MRDDYHSQPTNRGAHEVCELCFEKWRNENHNGNYPIPLMEFLAANLIVVFVCTKNFILKFEMDRAWRNSKDIRGELKKQYSIAQTDVSGRPRL